MSKLEKPPSAAAPRSGANLPNFRAVQLEFAAHLRNPDQNPKPADVDDRRMRVYRELVYNNIEGFVAGAFPIAKKLLTADPETQQSASSGVPTWHQLVREFVHQHASSSPYFLEVSQEFLEFLGQTQRDDLPPFFLELCHYEWVELALRVAEQEFPSTVNRAGLAVAIETNADLLEHCPVVSPLAKSLAYHFPVHRIRGDVPLSSVTPETTYLVVYRDRQDEVRFLEINAMTIGLLELLDGKRTGEAALRELAGNMAAPGLEEKVLTQGAQTLDRLRQRSIILGAIEAPSEIEG